MTGQCDRCETIPSGLPDAGQLHLWFPLAHSLQKAVQHLRGQSLQPEVDGAALSLSVALDAGLGATCDGIAAACSSEELTDIRALVTDLGAQPGPGDFGRITTLARMAGMARGSWLLALLREGRIHNHFQPIVGVGDTSIVHGHELLLRGMERDGSTTIPPNRIFDAARDADMLFQLDLAARRTAIASAAREGLETQVFVNFSPTSIYDPVFCLRSTVAAIESSGLRREQVVFEVVESDRTTDVSHLKGILDYYRSQGFRVALDDFGAGYSSVNMLHQLRPDYVKLDMELIRDVDVDPYKSAIARKVLEIAQELGIASIVEGVERPGELEWAVEHGADYVQGYLVAKPTAVPLRETPRLQRGLRAA
ncbi:MAG: ycgG [Thermoleophilia bacterium]|nr:ycgG [Thermoleophilia bacterium]